jgi:pyrroloquinoline quinone (PQQ) biosynthesis protein C
MTEIYHYTHHNAQNQALAAVRVGSERLELLRFCLRHAYEEAGHDLMVLHDLEQVGVERASVVAARPLPETQALISYLYDVSRTRDATARLGYSYWAESCYGEVRELIDAIRRDLGLSEAELTFFVAHEGIDRRHFEEVRTVALHACTTKTLCDGFLEVMENTLHLTGAMLDAVWRSVREPELVAL